MTKKSKKVIFLDFDGVLNTEYHQRQLQYEGKIWQLLYGFYGVLPLFIKVYYVYFKSILYFVIHTPPLAAFSPAALDSGTFCPGR